MESVSSIDSTFTWWRKHSHVPKVCVLIEDIRHKTSKTRVNIMQLQFKSFVLFIILPFLRTLFWAGMVLVCRRCVNRDIERQSGSLPCAWHEVAWQTARLTWLNSFTPRLLYPGDKSPRRPLNRKLGRPQKLVCVLRRTEKSLTPSRNRSTSPQSCIPCLVTISTTLSWLMAWR